MLTDDRAPAPWGAAGLQILLSFRCAGCSVLGANSAQFLLNANNDRLGGHGGPQMQTAWGFPVRSGRAGEERRILRKAVAMVGLWRGLTCIDPSIWTGRLPRASHGLGAAGTTRRVGA